MTPDDLMLHKLFADGRPTILVVADYRRAAAIRYADQWFKACGFVSLRMPNHLAAANVTIKVGEVPDHRDGIRVVGDKGSSWQFNPRVREALKEWV